MFFKICKETENILVIWLSHIFSIHVHTQTTQFWLALTPKYLTVTITFHRMQQYVSLPFSQLHSATRIVTIHQGLWVSQAMVQSNSLHLIFSHWTMTKFWTWHDRQCCCVIHAKFCCDLVAYFSNYQQTLISLGPILGWPTPGRGCYSVRFRIGMFLTARRLETLQGSEKGVETIHFAQFWWKIGVAVRHFPHFC